LPKRFTSHGVRVGASTASIVTSLGVTLHETIQTLVTWTESHQNEIAAARADYDARAAREAETAHAR
jgi:DNA-binding HxlR family transcriptional regulator